MILSFYRPTVEQIQLYHTHTHTLLELFDDSFNVNITDDAAVSHDLFVTRAHTDTAFFTSDTRHL